MDSFSYCVKHQLSKTLRQELKDNCDLSDDAITSLFKNYGDWTYEGSSAGDAFTQVFGAQFVALSNDFELALYYRG